MNSSFGRLLIVSHTLVKRHGGRLYVQGGFGRHVDAFARRWESVILLTCAEDSELAPDDYYLRGHNITLTPIRPFSTNGRLARYASMIVSAMQSAWRLPRLLRSCEVVHPRLPSAVGGTAALIVRFLRKPSFVYVSTDWEHSLLARSDRVAIKILARLVQRSLEFLVGDQLCFTAGKPLAEKYGGPSDRVVPLVTTALDRSHIVSEAEAEARTAETPREILFVGLVWEMKGLHVLLEALRCLLDGGLDVRLRGIGHAPDGGAWVDEHIRRLGLRQHVTIEDHMAWDRLLGQYDRSDLFVMPSMEGRGETGPKVVLEAMARGVPVVASRVGFVPDVISHGHNGWIVSPGSSEEIVEGVRRLWIDSDLRRSLAVNGVRTASKYVLDGVFEKITEAVRLIEHGQSPVPAKSGAPSRERIV